MNKVDECFAVAAYLIESGQLALYDTLKAIEEYEAKYGKMGEANET